MNEPLEPESPHERLERLISSRVGALSGVWGWNGSKARRIATREIAVEELADLEGSGMSTAGPRMMALIELLLRERT